MEKMNRLMIVGASGYGKVVEDTALLYGYEDIVFLDDDENVKYCAGFRVVDKSLEAPDGVIFVALGNSEIRKN